LIEADVENATAELSKLIRDLRTAGLNTEVRKGYDQRPIIFVQAPKDLLGNTVYKSRYAKH
jgi:anoctamin-10